MSKVALYNRLDRSPLDIAKVAIEDFELSSGAILVRNTSDGSQGTYDVRHYASEKDVPDFLKGKLFNVGEMK